MKISKIKLNNFRIYKGQNELDLSSKGDKNISVIAGKNGFGKTTFLTSLIWCFYGKLMTQVEDKYKKDVKNIGGYDNFLLSLINRDVKDESSDASFTVEVELKDLLIPSIPCRTVSIKRTYSLKTKEETLQILIDGDENELTKDVGFEVFINDFILPREIAKFFFFDAEKIVSLAEAKSKSELRSLSKAYSEVLGIKKYEELKNNLESLLTKLRRRGVSEHEEFKLKELLSEEDELEKIISHNQDKQDEIDKHLVILKSESDSLQEKLIREGNSITLEELKELKSKRDVLKEESTSIKQELRKLLDLVPLVIAGKHLSKLYNQLVLENDDLFGAVTEKILKKELQSFSKSILTNVDLLSLDPSIKEKIEKAINTSIKSKLKKKDATSKVGKVYLEFNEESFREFEAIYNNIKTTFLSQFNAIVKEEKVNKALLSRTINKIKQGEARKDNHLARQFRDEKTKADAKIETLYNEKNELLEELGGLRLKLTSHKKVRSEYEKNFNLVETDKKKYDVTQKLLIKINELIKRIKEDKKYSLQKSVSLGLKKLMHKEDFISNVRVNIIDDVMDIDLLDKNGVVIDKDSLSKGEQQLYATALLKALVDESGIKFPVFIDSPLQKFDKYHSKNIIKEFYPFISEQVVLFPLLEKELSEAEYELLKPNLNKAFLIHNTDKGSEIISTRVNNLFKEFKKEKDVYTY
ncbi:DNA sulfur modification protein DndD [Flavobacterium litorale]|uniref:DNA sulfur modification protein DndD n=1 Tax=Flavobacterium litorale TaxID=2856519 RepID=A0ABX8V7J6_9FLAO|nr:DNA sulfur modification protein DndD [Flavobacterium litorale]QYJ68791.1 DNA sulfur modification protein DndD [Flavobacterium litorale]